MRDLPAPGPDQDAQPWVVIGAAVQGTSHQRAGLACQDACAWRVSHRQAMLVAAADGLGSAARAGEGASLAATAVLDWLDAALALEFPTDKAGWENLLREGFAWARQQLQAAAREQPAELRDYGTTLMAAVIAEDWLATGHIGDGGVVALLEDESLTSLCVPQADEYLNHTFPLTLPNALQIAEFSARQEHVVALALLTDGLQQLALRLPDNRPHPAFFLPLFRQLPGVRDPAAASRKLADFLASERVCARTGDDKTLVLVGRPASRPPKETT
jgi:hypothetical protein